MSGNNTSLVSNVYVGKAFNAIVNCIGRDDLDEILFNWNDSKLHEDGEKIICYPGRDGRFSRGKEGGKVIVGKREFLTWLMSDSPFDEYVYGANIRNDAQWSGLIQRAREATFNMTCAPALAVSATILGTGRVLK
jgi:hypothetical protein